MLEMAWLIEEKYSTYEAFKNEFSSRKQKYKTANTYKKQNIQKYWGEVIK